VDALLIGEEHDSGRHRPQLVQLYAAEERGDNFAVESAVQLLHGELQGWFEKAENLLQGIRL